MIRDEIVTRSLVGAIEKYEQTLMGAFILDVI